MSWQAVQWALRDAPMLTTEAGKFDTTARLVLVALAEQARTPKGAAKDEKPRAFPSLATLRYMTGLDRRVIQRAIDRLADDKLIADVGRRGDVTVWLLDTDRRRPASDRTAIEREVEQRREQDRQRQRRLRTSRTQSPDAGPMSRTQNPESRTQNPVSRTQSTDVTHAEPPRTSKGTGNEPVNDPVPPEAATAVADALFDANAVKPSQRPKPVDPRDAQAQELAASYYEAMSKMVPFMGVKKVVKQALTAFTYEQVRAGLAHMSTVDRQRPLTRQTLLAAIESPSGRSANGQHVPYRNPVDQSVYDEPMI